MNRIIRSSLVTCLLLALAACSSSARRGTDSAAGKAKTAAPQAADPGSTLAAPSRAETLLAEGDRLQALGRCREALQQYGLAALEAGPAQQQALVSTYMCHWQMQRPKAAEESFMLWLRHEQDRGRLPLRLLFQPGEVQYLSDARITAPYPVWLRRVADATLASQHCLTLNGHAGPSAVEQYADELPLRRAQAVQRQLESLAPALKGRISVRAARPDEPVVGSASDDLRDALDRRVDFSIGPC